VPSVPGLWRPDFLERMAPMRFIYPPGDPGVQMNQGVQPANLDLSPAAQVPRPAFLRSFSLHLQSHLGRPCERPGNQSHPIAYFENGIARRRFGPFHFPFAFSVLFREWMAPIVRFIF
jgi:hypothetical protein